MRKFRWLTETTFGLNPHSSKLITEALNPFTGWGLKNWGFLLLKNSVMPVLNTGLDEKTKDSIAAPVDALIAKNPEAFKSKILISIGYSIAKFGWDIISTTINPYISKSMETDISNQLLSTTFEENKGSLNFFLHEIVLPTSEEGLLSRCITMEVSNVIEDMSRLTLRGPTAIISLYFACQTILTMGGMIAPYLSFPINTPYSILIASLALSVGQIAVRKFVSKLETANVNQNFTPNTSNALISFATKNSLKLASQDISGSIFQSISEQRQKASSTFTPYSMKKLAYSKINPLYDLIKSSMLVQTVGQAVLLGSKLTYQNTIGVITKSLGTIDTQLSFLMSITSLSKSADELNKLTQAMADAKTLYAEAEKHLVRSSSDIFTINASQDNPFIIARDETAGSFIKKIEKCSGRIKFEVQQGWQ